MSAASAFDLVLVLLLVGLSLWCIGARSTFASIAAFIGYGVLLMAAWMRLRAPDVALTEGAIAAGLGGILLFSALARGGDGGPNETRRMSASARALAILLCTVVGGSLVAVVLSLPEPAPTLVPLAAESLPRVGLGNPVNAVLLGSRALDTLMEKVVVFLAVVGVWSVARDGGWSGRPSLSFGTTTHLGEPRDSDQDGPIVLLARVLPPIGIVIAGYLLWNGANEPGGAFASAAVLSAMWLLVLMAGLSRLPRSSSRGWRAVIIAGPVLFMAAALLGYAMAGAFLAFPEAWSKPIIVVIEVALVVSVASSLVLLIAGPPQAEAAS